jgi:hypothetical protein
MSIKEHVLMVCDLCGIEKGSGSNDDYEEAKTMLALRLCGKDYQQAIKALADFLGV